MLCRCVRVIRMNAGESSATRTGIGASGMGPLAVGRLEAARLLGVSATKLWRLEQEGLVKQIPGLRGKYSVEALRRFTQG